VEVHATPPARFRGPAALLAFTRSVDVHEAERLLDRGCPPALAFDRSACGQAWRSAPTRAIIRCVAAAAAFIFVALLDVALPAYLVLVGLVVDVTLLVLGWLGVRSLWRRRPRRRRVPHFAPLPELTPDELLAELRAESREIRRRLAWLRVEAAAIERFLGLPADGPRDVKRRLVWLRAEVAGMQRFLGFPAD
jgi:hypothetical protein